MTNNLKRVELAEGQVSNQYATVNTSDGRTDAAITQRTPVNINNAGTFTVNRDTLTQAIELVLTPVATIPSSGFTVTLDNKTSGTGYSRGLIVIRNATLQTATVKATDQTLPNVTIEAGATALCHLSETNLKRVSGTVKFTDLSDVPHVYTGAAGYSVRVNAAGTGLEFDDLSASVPPSSLKWRVNVTASNDATPFLSIGDVEFREFIGVAETMNTVGGVASASPPFFGGDPATLLFNGLTNVRYAFLLSGGYGTGQFAEFDFTTARQVRQLCMKAPDTNFGEMAKDFTLDYWNGSAWITVLTVTGSTAWTSGLSRTFNVDYSAGGFQPHSAKLDALAALSWAANKITLQTSSSAVSGIDFTTQAQQLADDTSFGAMRTTMAVVALAGDTMTGPLVLPAGSVGTPALNIGGFGGLYAVSGKISVAIGGTEYSRLTSVGLALGTGIIDPVAALHVYRIGSGSANITLDGDAAGVNAGINLRTYFADANCPFVQFVKSRGSFAVPATILQNDSIGQFLFRGRGTTTTVVGATLNVQVIAASPSDTNMESKLIYYLCPPSSGTVSEALAVAHATGISLFANVVIDQNRDHRLRSYTIATLPAHVAGKIVYCSDTGGGASQLVSDGTNWQRLHPGMETLASDAAHTFSTVHLANARFIRGNTTLTANRTVTLGTAGVPKGAWFEFRRDGGGAFNWDIGGLKTLTIAGGYARVVFDGTAWYLSSSS